MTVGGNVQLLLAAPGPYADLLVSLGARAPLRLGRLGVSFLEPATTRHLRTVRTPNTMSARLPLDAALVGQTLCFQLLHPTRGLSRPVIGVLELP